MANYDAYYMRYRRGADTHNRASKKRIAFQGEFMQDHLEVMPFLPGDKFSF